MPATVSVIPLDSYDDPKAVLSALREALAPFGGISAIVPKGKRVLLKPNLVAPSKPDMAVTTHPAILRGVLELLKETEAIVSVGDGPGVGSTAAAAAVSGLLEPIKENGATLVDFKGTRTYEEPNNRIAKHIDLTEHLATHDVLITLPKLKTHTQMAFTGALKNQYGLIPGAAKGQFHFRFQDRNCLADLMIDINRIAKPALAVMDAVVGMEGPGPSGGTPRKIGALIVGTDLAAVDTVACAIIGLKPEDVPVTMATRRAGFGETDLNRIAIHGAAIDRMRIADFELVKAPCNIMRILPLPIWALRWLRRQLVARPVIDTAKCIRCLRCQNGCPVQPAAIQPTAEGGPVLNDQTCIRCYCCHEFCPVKAIDLKRSLLDRMLHLTALANLSTRALGSVMRAFDPRRLMRRP